jgi:hypothetical protein
MLTSATELAKPDYFSILPSIVLTSAVVAALISSIFLPFSMSEARE